MVIIFDTAMKRHFTKASARNTASQGGAHHVTSRRIRQQMIPTIRKVTAAGIHAMDFMVHSTFKGGL
jgi:hypothetical protein